MNTATIVGVIASVLSASSLVPQLVKLLQQKKAGDISVAMLIILFAGLSCWVYYGVLQKDVIIIASNSFSVLINVLILIFTLKYKRSNER